MMNGTKLLEGYIPEYDATVVTRILDAGEGCPSYVDSYQKYIINW